MFTPLRYLRHDSLFVIVLAWTSIFVIIAPCRASDPAAIQISIAPLQQGTLIPDRFAGLSYESLLLLPDQRGNHYFDPNNKALIGEFRSLGVRSLRIGGSSVDKAMGDAPSHADIDALFEFARAAKVKVIYALKLRDANVSKDAAIAKYIVDHYPDELDSLAIGNEPEGSYDVYHGQWQQIEKAITAVAPNAKFSGPGTNPNPVWFKQFVTDFSDSTRLALLTGHLYAGGCSYINPIPGSAWPSAAYSSMIPRDPQMAREDMIGPKWDPQYAEVLQGMNAAVDGKSLPIRLEETNSFWYGGLRGASDSYASTFWAIDYLYWWASHGIAGLNFHTGDMVSGPIPGVYAAFVTDSDGYATRPLGYGMKVFDLAAHGRLILPDVSTNDPQFSAYAAIRKDRSLWVTLINKHHGPDAASANVTLTLTGQSTMSSAKSVALCAPNADLSASSGLTLGGAAIEHDGAWSGSFTPCAVSPDRASTTINVPPATVVVVKIQLR